MQIIRRSDGTEFDDGNRLRSGGEARKNKDRDEINVSPCKRSVVVGSAMVS